MIKNNSWYFSIKHMRDTYLRASISFFPFNQTFQKKKKSFKIYLIPIISILCQQSKKFSILVRYKTSNQYEYLRIVKY